MTVETSYVQLARPDGAGWSLRAPLATAPRYVRSDERTSRHAQGQPLALLRDPGHRFALDVTLAGAASASSATHELATTPVEGGLRVQLAAGEVVPDRDLVLSWQLPQADRPALQCGGTATWRRAVYWLAAITPPALGPASHGLRAKCCCRDTRLDDRAQVGRPIGRCSAFWRVTPEEPWPWRSSQRDALVQ